MILRSQLHRLGGAPAVRLLREHVRSQLPWLLLASGCMAVYAAATAAQAWLLEPILDRVFLARDRQMLLLVPLAVVAIALLKAGAGYSQTAAMARAGQRIVADLQRRLFEHVVRADLGEVAGRGPGPLISSLIYDTQLLRAAVSSSLTSVARDLLTVLFLLGLDVLARSAARGAGAGGPAARDPADQPRERAHPRGGRGQPGRDGEPRRPCRAGLPRHPAGQGGRPRGG